MGVKRLNREGYFVHDFIVNIVGKFLVHEKTNGTKNSSTGVLILTEDVLFEGVDTKSDGFVVVFEANLGGEVAETLGVILE